MFVGWQEGAERRGPRGIPIYRHAWRGCRGRIKFGTYWALITLQDLNITPGRLLASFGTTAGHSARAWFFVGLQIDRRAVGIQTLNLMWWDARLRKSCRVARNRISGDASGGRGNERGQPEIGLQVPSVSSQGEEREEKREESVSVLASSTHGENSNTYCLSVKDHLWVEWTIGKPEHRLHRRRRTERGPFPPEIGLPPDGSPSFARREALTWESDVDLTLLRSALACVSTWHLYPTCHLPTWIQPHICRQLVPQATASASRMGA
jgi:hypothetical protein